MSEFKRRDAQATKPEDQVQNRLRDFTSNLLIGDRFGAGSSQISQSDTQYLNLRYYPVSNDRSLLSWMYEEHGLVKNFIDVPVEDAFRGGFEIYTDLLDEKEKRQMHSYMTRNRVTYQIKQALKWMRLYGGSALIIFGCGRVDQPIDLENIQQGDEIEFRSADLWEIYHGLPAPVRHYGMFRSQADLPEFLSYYDMRVHKSRVMFINGKEPPSFLLPRYRGWGSSILEPVIRSLNQFMKYQKLIFELIDEAKVDVYKITDFNQSMFTSDGAKAVADRISQQNQVKNWQNAITMDVEDDYQQKQIQFSGIAEVIKQIRQNVAGDLKMPLTKLFGISASGFNAGDDDLENYNASIESELRENIKPYLMDVISVVAQTLFGTTPDDLEIHFHPLRTMTHEQEENVKNQQFNRLMVAAQQGYFDQTSAIKRAINEANLLPIRIEETDDLNEALREYMQEGGGAGNDVRVGTGDAV